MPAGFLRTLTLLVLVPGGVWILGTHAARSGRVLIAAVPSAPLQPPQVFRATTDLVRLDVTVLGRDGLPVRGLTAADFTILDAASPRPVETFAEVDLPAWPADTAPWVRDVEPDVVSNRGDARRAVVILMDDSTTMLDPGHAIRAKAIANAVIDGLGPADTAAVVYTASRREGQEFTRDRARLRASVARFVPAGPAPAPGAMSAEAPTRRLEIPSQNLLPSGRCPGNRCRTDALRNAAEILGGWPGTRKLVVMIGSGQLVRSGVGDLDTLSDELQRTMQALQQANMTVYEFDPRGLEVAPAPTNFSLFADNVTGGRAFKDTNAPEEHVSKVFRENSSYYLLGFRPSDERRDGRFRRVKVDVNRPGLEVRTRSGYYAAADSRAKASASAANPIDVALARGLPTGDLPLLMGVTPLAVAGKPGAAMAVTVGIDRGSDPGREVIVDIAAAAFDVQWRQVAGQTQRAVLPRAAGVSETTLRLNLKPGRYEVRAAVEAPDGRVGSAFTSITLPDFARAPLSLSGLAICEETCASLSPDASALALPRLTTSRTFDPDRRVSLYARIYQGGVRQPAPVRIVTRIVDERGAELASAESALDPSGFDGNRQAEFRFDLPLARLGAGERLLTLQATAGTASALRELRFRVSR